jgi:hypothetical protein
VDEEREERRQKLSLHEIAGRSTSKARGIKQCKFGVGLGRERARPCGKRGEKSGPLWWLIGLERYDRNPSVCGGAVATGALARGSCSAHHMKRIGPLEQERDDPRGPEIMSQVPKHRIRKHINNQDGTEVRAYQASVEHP